MKRIICFILSLVFICGTAAAYSDISGHYAEDAINKYSELGIVMGYDGGFFPEMLITRGEMAVILNRIMNYQDKSENSFKDLKEDFYTDAILKANKAGVLFGSDGLIKPNDYITREETAVMLCRALKIKPSEEFSQQFSDAEKTAFWAYSSCAAVYTKDYSGEGLLKPSESITRGETVALLDSLIGAIITKSGTYSEDIGGICIINCGGVTLSDATVSGDVILTGDSAGGELTLTGVKISGTLFADCKADTVINIDATSEIAAIDEDCTADVRKETPPPVQAESEESSEDEYYSSSYSAEQVCVTVSIEAFNAGLGYIAAPTIIELESGANAAYAVQKALEANGIEPVHTGTMESGYYISCLKGISTDQISVPEVVRNAVVENGYAVSTTVKNEGELGEADLAIYSGWIFCINGKFGTNGLSDCPISDGDVIRLQFSLAFGSDLGNEWAFFPVADRTELTKRLAVKNKSDYQEYMTLIAKPDLTEDELSYLLSVI